MKKEDKHIYNRIKETVFDIRDSGMDVKEIQVNYETFYKLREYPEFYEILAEDPKGNLYLFKVKLTVKNTKDLSFMVVAK